ncbi:protocadherin Fat 4, partial [Aplysia californica]|uniref:Protocadherin Fat 4 n=1 Tax=Aplysia californica TaxID=6500 RepID=A0ABM0KB48_APLCA
CSPSAVDESASLCEAMGGRLAAVTDRDEYIFLKQFILSQLTDDTTVWISGTDRYRWGHWVDIHDQKPVSILDLASPPTSRYQQDGGHCLALTALHNEVKMRAVPCQVDTQQSSAHVPDLSVTDADIDQYGPASVRYELAHEVTVPFAIDATSGELTVLLATSADRSAVLDRETRDFYDLQIFAVDYFGRGRNASAHVLVNITDVNDEAPYFLQPVYEFNVSEATARGHVIGQVQADDKDLRSAVLIYTMDDSKMFSLNPLTGNVTVVGMLDRETQSEYELTVRVSDGLNTGNTTVRVHLTDSNDNCPVWDVGSLAVNVTENQAPSSLDIGQLLAVDGDLGPNGEVTFFINDTYWMDFLHISPNGSIFLGKPLPRSPPPPYSVPVYASDGGLEPCVVSDHLTVAVMEENDFDPEICYKGQCGVSDIEGNITTTGGLDRETQSLYHVTVQARDSTRATLSALAMATDHGVPPQHSNLTVVVEVVDINDNSPVFESPEYTVTFSNLSVPMQQ